MKVKTRFAPSPTGLMHIGSVRTALYAYLVAKKNDGEFYLRIEDTDQNRLVEGATEDIIETLKWLGLEFNGEPTYQSKRKSIYEEHAKQLVKGDKAYEQDGAIWFKINTADTTKIIDLVGNRKLEIPNKDQKDFVILKSDGFPTYHLAHVMDDHLMETNPVIRGPEWISSLPKHIQLFEAFGWQPVSYAHVPVILGPDKSKLSKRHGAKAVSEYRKDGFLPEAILNYMALLGWTPPSGKEILSLDEMVKEFDLKDVHVSSPVFDVVKLEWMNGEYIRKLSDEELAQRLVQFLSDISEGSIKESRQEKEKIMKIIPLIKERIKKLSEFIPLTDFLFEAPEYEKSVFEKAVKEKVDLKKVLSEVIKTMENLKKPWQSADFEKAFRQFAQEHNISPSSIFQLIRIGVSGQPVTPPLFESIAILGEDETLKRLSQTLNIL